MFVKTTFLLQQKMCFVETKHVFVTTTFLLQQKMCFVETKHVFVTTTFLLQQKMCFVETKHVFVTTTFLLQQKMCFVETNTCLSRQHFCCNKRCVLLRQTRVCHDNIFVATKMILVAAPAHDRFRA